MNHSIIDARELYGLGKLFAFIRKFTIEKAAIRVTSGSHAEISTAIFKDFSFIKAVFDSEPTEMLAVLKYRDSSILTYHHNLN